MVLTIFYVFYWNSCLFCFLPSLFFSHRNYFDSFSFSIITKRACNRSRTREDLYAMWKLFFLNVGKPPWFHHITCIYLYFMFFSDIWLCQPGLDQRSELLIILERGYSKLRSIKPNSSKKMNKWIVHQFNALYKLSTELCETNTYSPLLICLSISLHIM